MKPYKLSISGFLCILICIIILMFIIYILSKKSKENFSECSLSRNYNFDSINTVITINENRYDYEYSIEEVQKVVNKYKDNKMNTSKFISWLNLQKELYHDNKKYYIVKKHNNELIIYRNGKAYGFHMILSKNKIYVKGLIMQYVIDKMLNINDKEQTLEYIHQRHLSDVRFSAYV